MCLPASCWCSQWRLPSTPSSNGSSARRRSGRPVRAPDSARPTRSPPALSSLRPDGVRVFDLTLTFDNGPEPDVTPRVLDILGERNIKTTFFVIGEKLGDPERRRLAARAHDEGHWIGNHTFTHTIPLGQQPDAGTAQNEIGRTQTAIGDLAHPYRWFRPFGGGGNLDDRLLKPSVVEYLTRNEPSFVLWNAIPRDWDDPDGWTDRALAQCAAQPWSLMVLHDLP